MCGGGPLELLLVFEVALFRHSARWREDHRVPAEWVASSRRPHHFDTRVAADRLSRKKLISCAEHVVAGVRESTVGPASVVQ